MPDLFSNTLATVTVGALVFVLATRRARARRGSLTIELLMLLAMNPQRRWYGLELAGLLHTNAPRIYAELEALCRVGLIVRGQDDPDPPHRPWRRLWYQLAPASESSRWVALRPWSEQ